MYVSEESETRRFDDSTNRKKCPLLVSDTPNSIMFCCVPKTEFQTGRIETTRESVVYNRHHQRRQWCYNL